MAKKFVRCVTGVEDIEQFDKTLTNINDLISDGQDTYVHTKKGKVESYYNLTDNLKTITSDDSTLMTVTKDDTTNNVTINPKHDTQKEQSLESTRNTVTIKHGSNGTRETTKVETNPQKVLEHENLLNDYGVSKTTSDTTSKIGLEYTAVQNGFDLNTLNNGLIRAGSFINSPSDRTWYFVSSFVEGNYAIQKAVALLDSSNKTYIRYRNNGSWEQWREQVGDKSVIDGLLAQKQNKIENNGSIAPSGDGLRQLLTNYQTYTHTNGILNTYSKWVSLNSHPDTQIYEEAYFTVKINKGATSATFTIDENDNRKFNKIMTSYGQNNSVIINGCILTLSGSYLTVTTSNNVDNNYVITFSNVI